jgi:tetratricopeptide (TPR) repeat protein
MQEQYYQQALIYIEQAVRYDRDDEIYYLFFDRAAKQYELQLRKEYKTLLQNVKAHIRKGLYGETEKILDKYIRRSGITEKNEEVLALYTEIRAGYAQNKYRVAAANTRKNDFLTALEDVEEAIRLEPEDARYIDYLSVIHKRSEAFNRRAYEMIERKPFFQSGYREQLTLHAAGQIQTFTDPYRELKVRGVYPGANLGLLYFSRFVDPLFINFFTDAAITAGTNDQRFPEGTLTNNFWYLQLAGGLGGTLAFSYLDIGIGAGIHLGFLRSSYTETIFGNAEEGTDGVFIFGPQISMGGSYYITKQFAVTARYRLQWLLRISQRTVPSHSISIGGGVNL